MSDKKKDETTIRDRFKIWIYVGFAILGILLVLFLIGLFYYLFSSSSYRSNSSTVPKTTTSSLPIETRQTSSSNDRSTYMSSLFRRGGGLKNRLKRY